MIDIESEVFGAVAAELRTKWPKLYMVGEYVRTPKSFPCVSLEERDNSVLSRTQTGSEIENHATLMYEANVYSNKANGKKAECRAIATALDAAMARLGFTRIMMNPIPNMDDATIYRITARYRAVVGKDKTIYRR